MDGRDDRGQAAQGVTSGVTSRRIGKKHPKTSRNMSCSTAGTSQFSKTWAQLFAGNAVQVSGCRMRRNKPTGDVLKTEGALRSLDLQKGERAAQGGFE